MHLTAPLHWSRSIGTNGRDPSELVVTIAGMRTQLGNFTAASRCIEEAMTFIKITKDKADEAEAHRIAGEIALKSPKHDIAKAEAYFQSALAIARQLTSQVLGTTRRNEHGAA